MPALPEAVPAEPLTSARYRPYGDVIAAGVSSPANQGTARRSDFLAELRSLRPRAKPNLCVFRCLPFRGRVFPVRLLERHAFSTQVFLPLGSSARCLIIVALGGPRPDLSTLRAFLLDGPRGVSYRPGIWHHPMVVLGRRTDMACLVWEDGTPRDGEVVRLAGAVSASVEYSGQTR
jgi:ureidoglycolate lyase